MEGRMYPGSFECENEKKTIGMIAQRTRNSGNASPGRFGARLFGFSRRSRHSATDVCTPSINARTAITVHGISPSSTTTR
jgi:hypothetical protein